MAEARRPLPETVAEAAERVARLKREAAEAEAKLQKMLPADLPPPPVMRCAIFGAASASQDLSCMGCRLAARADHDLLVHHLQPCRGVRATSCLSAPRCQLQAGCILECWP